MNDLGGNIDVKYKGKQIDMSLTNLKETSSNPENTAIIKLVAMMSQPRYQTFKELAKETVTKNLQKEIDEFSSAGMQETVGKNVAIAYTKKLQDQLDAVSNINVNDIDVKRQTGKIYKVGLAPKPDELLDYDKSLRQQPKFAEVLKPLYDEYGVAETADIGTLFESIKGKRGISAPDLADRLSKAGIPGIKYTAAGSRGANIDAADVEKNYVIFDDKAIKILEKYGIVGPVAITALGAAKQEGADDGNST
jgi:hypothetical protein